MSRKHHILLFVFTLLNLCTHSQNKKVQISFNPKWKENSVVLNTFYSSSNKTDSILISKMKFYVSKVSLVSDDKSILINKSFLIDLEESNSMSMEVPEEFKIKQLFFLLGTDSTTNVSGAMDGDLDPLKGMYWTWQSGFINVKIEGTHLKSDGETDLFHLHLGGYRSPYLVNKKMKFQIEKASNEISFYLDLDLFLETALQKGLKNIMSPGESAMELMEAFSKTFKLN
ncbi:MAG: hypothetical protein RL582_1361 [Bacteroidota bacterium]